MILDAISDTVRRICETSSLSIRDLFLGNFYNVVELSDGSTGAALHYGRFASPADAEENRSRLLAAVSQDPLLDRFLHTDLPDSLRLSLRVAVLSALSRKLIIRGVGFRMVTCMDVLPHPLPWQAAKAAVVVGFGGYLCEFLRTPNLRSVHVVDLTYIVRRNEIEAHLEPYRQADPSRQITASDGSDTSARLAEADLTAITGSALCNGTMDFLLDAAARCRFVIVQGNSAAVYPPALFAAGVGMVTTTLKPADLICTGRSDPNRFWRLFEGGLPQLHLLPLK